jgi:Cyclic nucleotide-binding domain
MRFTSAVTSVSWIPSEAITGPLVRLPFDIGFTHYDDPPPDRLVDLETLLEEGHFRFANHLQAWIEVEDGRIVSTGHEGRSYINRTLARMGRRTIAFQPTPFPEIRDTEVRENLAIFTQTAGGKPGIPAPRRVNHPPFVQLVGPSVWSTLSLTMSADGESRPEIVGASTFPRHWLYGQDGELISKSGTINFQNWYRTAFGSHTPWGDEQSPVQSAALESALEREMSRSVMKPGAGRNISSFRGGEALMRQGESGTQLFLLLDGIVSIEVDGEPVAELGPGAILGERALLEEGVRTSTVTAVTDCRVAMAEAGDIDRESLVELSGLHRREEEQE